MNWFAISILVVLCVSILYMLYSIVKTCKERHLLSLIREKGLKCLFNKKNKEEEEE